MSNQTLLKRQSPEWLLPALLMLLGAFLRLIQLGNVPGGLHQDEAFVALNAFDIFHEGVDSAGIRMPVYMSDWGDGHSAMYVWLLLPLLFLNGGHITPFLLRLPQAAVAILTLWSAYCLMSRMFGRKAGLWTLLVLATCPWHIMMCRWGLDANLAPGFLIFALSFFVRGLENEKFLPLSALFYGLSLYCYAVVWPVVPVMLLIQIVYGLYHKKLRINRNSILSACLLFVLALPLILFVLVNSNILPEISLPFLTIPRFSGYRASEVAGSFSVMWAKLRAALVLFIKQNTGSPFDILLPWGLFYDIGRIFIVIGVFVMLFHLFRKLFQKQFCYEFYLFAPLVGGGITCLLVAVNLHQINDVFIPLLLCESYGIYVITEAVGRRKPILKKFLSTGLIVCYLLCTALFQRDYYTDYKELVNAYFGQGIQECVDYAVDVCHSSRLDTISVEKGAQWPRLLLYTETLPSEYLASVTYDVPPAPACFDTQGIHINTRIHYETIDTNSVYILYFTDVPAFEAEFDLTPFYDWYVAVPKNL